MPQPGWIKHVVSFWAGSSLHPNCGTSPVLLISKVFPLPVAHNYDLNASLCLNCLEFRIFFTVVIFGSSAKFGTDGNVWKMFLFLQRNSLATAQRFICYSFRIVWDVINIAVLQKFNKGHDSEIKDPPIFCTVKRSMTSWDSCTFPLYQWWMSFPLDVHDRRV